MAPNADEHLSFPELNYPTIRDAGTSVYSWLYGKILDDGAQGFWRIHDKLYDLTPFIDQHPGGQDWLFFTKGTDITEAFESHHISTLPEKMLSKYFVGYAKTKRNSPFTFKEDGFYRILKKRVRDDLEHVPRNVDSLSKRIVEGLILSTFIFSIIACRSQWFWNRISLCLIAGVCMAWTTACSHNFVHQKDNWRMYLLNFPLLVVKEFRVFHVLSHHSFPNTLFDMEISSLEPIIQWLPRKTKKNIVRFGPIFYSAFVYVFFMDYIFMRRLIENVGELKISLFTYEDLIPFSLPLVMYMIGNADLVTTIIVWLAIIHVCSFLFVALSFNTRHHHPDVFHDGDTPREDRDWGLHQVSTVIDRTDLHGSLFKVLTAYGDHGLHHLFPALDHSVLPYLEESFAKTCKEFKAELRVSTQLQMFIGSYQQMARVNCKL